MSIHYIYLRQWPVKHNAPKKEPIGCIAYDDVEPNIFLYGYSVIHPDVDLTKKSGITIPPFLAFSEDGKSVQIKGGVNLSMKQAARHIARIRLEMARKGIKRKRCRGKYGRVDVVGNFFTDKLKYMLSKIWHHDDTRLRTKESISNLIGHLSVVTMNQLPRQKSNGHKLPTDFHVPIERLFPKNPTVPVYNPRREAV